ncbi:hypothetical protein [Staphylococcus chromogenes]|uniref:hypothetical protein n=1 Tax=Staphylococcus chromogenes TaxID=46126 RepID=UPI0039E12399
MVQCMHCHRPLDDADAYCRFCGAQQQISRRQKQPQSVHRNVFKRIAFWMGIGISIATSAILLVMMARWMFISPTHADENKTQIHQVNTKIDVLSQNFSQGFMKRPQTGAYDGLHVGMSRQSAEKMLGRPTTHTEVSGEDVTVYGNVGIHYEDDAISDLFIIPHHVSKEAFLRVHGAPTIQNGNHWYYDDHAHNEHTINVTVEGQHIKAIENIPQI